MSEVYTKCSVCGYGTCRYKLPRNVCHIPKTEDVPKLSARPKTRVQAQDRPQKVVFRL